MTSRWRAAGCGACCARPHTSPRGYARYVLVRDAGRVVPVRVEDIAWVEARGKYLRLHCGPAVHLLRESIGQLESRLDPAMFARIHRSTIVNLQFIRELE